jgi:hypothetical protein
VTQLGHSTLCPYQRIKIMKRKLLLVILLGLVLSGPAAALADGDIYSGGPLGTRITYLPYTINDQGAYYLGGNLSTATGDGITINKDNVTLDLMGYSLTYNGSGSQTGISMNGRTNVEIRNGMITNWNFGIYEGGAGVCHRILNVRLNGCYNGVILYGTGHLIQGCEAKGTPGSWAFYIQKVGAISDCRATNFDDTGGYLGDGGIYRGNVITGNGAASSNGLMLENGAQGLMMGNEVNNGAYGLNFWTGTSVIDNTVTTVASGGSGIIGNYDPATVLDQNTVMGTGTHTAFIGGVQLRNNAGIP